MIKILITGIIEKSIYITILTESSRKNYYFK